MYRAYWTLWCIATMEKCTHYIIAEPIKRQHFRSKNIIQLKWKNQALIASHSHATNPHYSLSHLQYTFLWWSTFELHTVICSSWRDKDLILSGAEQNIVDQLLRYTWNKQEGVRVWVLFRAFAQWEPFVIFGGRKGAENGKNWAIVRSLLWQVGLLRAN